MERFQLDISAIPNTAKDTVVVIGNFDGVHRGHCVLLERAYEIANQENKRLSVLTFEPHPRELFRPDEPPCRITPYDLKAERLAKQNVDILFHAKFDWDFASLTYQDFIEKILKDKLAAHHVVVGFDFHFGQMRKGTADHIREAGIPVTTIDEITGQDSEELSSSRIRQYLRRGDIDHANALLGWEWELYAEVIKGDQRGRELGYPTANMELGQTLHPAYGVYATLARLDGESEWRMAATNIGIRPMFETKVALVETFIFDFDKEIYGRTLHVKPVKRLRSEAKFDNLDDLITQMDKDCTQAREILAQKLKA